MRFVVGAAAAALVLPAFTPPLAAATARHSRPAVGHASHGALPYFDIRLTSPQATTLGARSGRHVTSRIAAARTRLTHQLGARTNVDVDPATGTVRSLQRLGGALTGPSSAKPADLAWNYVRGHVAALGLDDNDLSAFRLTDRQATVHGLRTLRWTESYQGIPAFDNDLRVNVDRSGRIISLLGSPLHNMTVSSIQPQLSASLALAALKANVGSTKPVSVVSASSGVRHMTHFSTGDFARLVIFGGAGAPRLAWHLTFAASSDNNYDAVVDASTGQVLYRQNLTKADSNVSVWQNFPGAATGGAAATVDLSTPTTASPTGYLNSGAVTLIGPNAHAWSDVNDNDVADSSEEVGPSSGADFIYPFTNFNATATDGHCSNSAPCSWDGDIDNTEALTNPTSWMTDRKQNAAQAFWFVNNFHDHLASAPIGFASTENFEGDDPVLVNADDGAASGSDGGPDFNHLDNANMTTEPVGTSPKMQMYLFNFDPNFGPFRDINGGDAAAVVYHEYTHGLSNRLITNDDGTGALSSPEAGAMGEAWSDWYAEDYLVRQGLQPDSPSVAGEVNLGTYTDAQPDSIRTQPMDCPVGSGTATVCPGGGSGHTGGYTFGDFGKIIGAPEVHADGEIWGETLWDLRAALIAAAGNGQTGSDNAEEIITDGMRLSPPEPSYLDERNAILGAIQADFSGAQGTAMTSIAWTVFSHRGMGYFAGAADGSDVNPIEDFSLPPAPGGPTGTISGTVTSSDSGLPVSGITVAIGGQGDVNASPKLAAATTASGHYTIAGVPTGTYGDLVVYASSGFDQVKLQHVHVTNGHTTVANEKIHRDWSALSGGATITSTDETGESFGCGSAQLIDQSQGTGWSAFNPSSTDPSNPHAGAPTATIKLPRSITVRAFLADPANACGDGPSSTTKAYKIETSPNGTTWTIAKQGNFTPADAHRLNSLTPTAGTKKVRYVRLIASSPQSAAAGSSGADFIDFTELEVLGAPPNVLPSGSLKATPGTIKQGGKVHFNASSFHDPDSKITGYAWDFDGNGKVDRTTAGPTTSHTYNKGGTFTAKVTAKDFEGGGGSATVKVHVKLAGKPSVSIAKKGTHAAVTVTFVCKLACKLKATETISNALRVKYGLASTTVGTISSKLHKAGTKSVSITLTPAVVAALKAHHASRLKVTITAVTTDSNHRKGRATQHATVHR